VGSSWGLRRWSRSRLRDGAHSEFRPNVGNGVGHNGGAHAWMRAATLGRGRSKTSSPPCVAPDGIAISIVARCLAVAMRAFLIPITSGGAPAGALTSVATSSRCAARTNGFGEPPPGCRARFLGASWRASSALCYQHADGRTRMVVMAAKVDAQTRAFQRLLQMALGDERRGGCWQSFRPTWVVS
jgi:hypothetical protein